MRRYLWLFALALVAALVAGAVARAPRGNRIESAAPAAGPVTAMTVTIRASGVVASLTEVPSGSAVLLHVVNAGAATARLQLAGYEDRVDTGPLDPGGTTRIEFIADRPGERFAWMVGDEPHGRLDVTGSHLVEGHR